MITAKLRFWNRINDKSLLELTVFSVFTVVFLTCFSALN